MPGVAVFDFFFSGGGGGGGLMSVFVTVVCGVFCIDHPPLRNILQHVFF